MKKLTYFIYITHPILFNSGDHCKRFASPLIVLYYSIFTSVYSSSCCIAIFYSQFIMLKTILWQVNTICNFEPLVLVLTTSTNAFYRIKLNVTPTYHARKRFGGVWGRDGHVLLLNLSNQSRVWRTGDSLLNSRHQVSFWEWTGGNLDREFSIDKRWCYGSDLWLCKTNIKIDNGSIKINQCAINIFYFNQN